MRARWAVWQCAKGSVWQLMGGCCASCLARPCLPARRPPLHLQPPAAPSRASPRCPLALHHQLPQGMELLAKEGYEFVAVFDADFKPEPSFLEKTVPYLVGNPEVRSNGCRPGGEAGQSFAAAAGVGKQGCAADRGRWSSVRRDVPPGRCGQGWQPEVQAAGSVGEGEERLEAQALPPLCRQPGSLPLPALTHAAPAGGLRAVALGVHQPAGVLPNQGAGGSSSGQAGVGVWEADAPAACILACARAAWVPTASPLQLPPTPQEVSLNYHMKCEQYAHSAARSFFNFNGTAGVWRGALPRIAGQLGMEQWGHLQGAHTPAASHRQSMPHL